MRKSKKRFIKKNSRTKKNKSVYTDEAKRIIKLTNAVKKYMKQEKNTK
jgi:hypothetical protein